jgi:PAS domain S-box-containing protein
MQSNLQEIFTLASKYFYKEFKENGGTQKVIAEELGVTPSYVSAVLNGSRYASLSLLEQIATILSGKPLDEFLVVGRRIKNGLKPLQEESPIASDSPENLIARLSHYIIDHQRIEQELAEKQWLLQAALDIATYGIVIVAKDKNVLAYNKTYKDMIGYPDEILETRKIMVYVKWSRHLILDQVRFDKELEEALNANTLISHNFKLKDGRTLKRRTSPIYKKGGLAGWIIYLVDITPTKRKDDINI